LVNDEGMPSPTLRDTIHVSDIKSNQTAKTLHNARYGLCTLL